MTQGATKDKMIPLGAIKLRKWLDTQEPRKRPSHFARDCGGYPATFSRYLSGAQRPDLASATEIEKQTNGGVTRDDWLKLVKKPAP